MNASAPGQRSEPPFLIDLQINADAWNRLGDTDLATLAETAIRASVAAGGLETVADSELSICFTDDAQVQDLNAAWRGKDKPTNVLSFPGQDDADGPIGPLIGDIVLAYETIFAESRDLGIPFEHHLTHLIVHGLLHLFGYDHETEDEAQLMEGLETTILGSLGIADPYASATSILEQ